MPSLLCGESWTRGHEGWQNKRPVCTARWWRGYRFSTKPPSPLLLQFFPVPAFEIKQDDLIESPDPPLPATNHAHLWAVLAGADRIIFRDLNVGVLWFLITFPNPFGELKEAADRGRTIKAKEKKRRNVYHDGPPTHTTFVIINWIQHDTISPIICLCTCLNCN